MLVDRGQVRISSHGYDELAADDILIADVIAGVTAAMVVEDYPYSARGPCVLVLQKDAEGRPVHVVWGIPENRTGPAVVVTAYRPDPARWSRDFSEAENTMNRGTIKIAHEGRYAAEIPVELIEEEGGWWNEAFGGFQSAGFPVAMVDGPITLPPVNVRPQTSPPERSDHPPGGATPGVPTEGGKHPPGDLSSAGQPNQSPTAQSINQIRQVRPVKATTSTSGSTRPARILPSQQGAGPLQQGTGTDETIGVPQLRPALALPLQRDTVVNQTVLPLQQGTSTNQNIAVPQVRPVLVLPQGTVQTALPLPLQQGTGSNQKIGVGQVRPANGGASMRAQGVIGKRL